MRRRVIRSSTLASLLTFAAWVGGVAAFLPWGSVAGAVELSSESYRLRGAHEASIAASALQSAGPRFGEAGAGLGQADALGFAAGDATLSTSLPGFWPVTQGGLPSLDLDGDGEIAWLDPDDDDDGLLDTVETNTGVFVSSSDTGTDPALADSDGDGVPDGTEVAEGSDPNDPESIPAVPQVPAVPLAAGWVLALWLAASTRRTLRRAGGVV